MPDDNPSGASGTSPEETRAAVLASLRSTGAESAKGPDDDDEFEFEFERLAADSLRRAWNRSVDARPALFIARGGS